MSVQRVVSSHIVAAAWALVLGISGCGVIEQPLPAITPGFNLEMLAEIQDDERLTDDERRERIRELVGAPMDDSGDRLVEFLLNFNLP